MTEKQADQIFDYIAGMLRPPDRELTRLAWRISLSTLDPDIASKAMIEGLQVWEHWPSWPQLMIEYHQVQRRRVSSQEQKEREKCHTCLDVGWVLAQLRYDAAALKKGAKPEPDEKAGPFEEWAPCPHCERGKAIEGQAYGTAGYWQGRDTTYLRPVEGTSAVEPSWVPRWRQARAVKDERPFPAQYEELTAEARPKKPYSDRTAWVQDEEYAGEGHA